MKLAARARLAGSAGINTGEAISPLVIDLENETGQLLPYSNVLRTGKMEMVAELANKFSYVPVQPWSDPTHTAVIIPVPSVKPHHYSGIIVAGASPRLRFNESYKSFFELLTTQVANAITNASAFEEERKRAEALEEIDKAKTIFFSNISHEFRTPLTLMLSPLEELLNQRENNFTGQEKQNLETTHRNALRLLKLVNALLDFSRIESGRQQANFTLVDISALTKDLAGNFRSIIEKAGLEFVVNCDSILQPVYVDRQMWEKIVFNLLSNAFKYTLKGAITVEIFPDKDFAVLKIKDTGVGVPENEIPNLFERFHRVHNVMGRTYEGAGIGLSLIKQLVQLHAGIINVESRLNEGSTFTVKIPFGKEHLTAAQIVDETAADKTDDVTSAVYIKEAESLIEKYAFEKKATSLNNHKKLPLVMVVDDNADMREHLRSVLSKRFNIVTANNGMDALQKLGVETPDLILSDIMMPVMDGTGLLKEIRSNKATANIPVIFLTARAGEESKIEGWEIGADDYLVKPFSSRELVSRVASQIYTKKIRDDAQQELQNIFRQAPVSIVVYRGKDYKVEVANDMALQMWNKSWKRLPINPSTKFPRPLILIFPLYMNRCIKQGYHFMVKSFLPAWNRMAKMLCATSILCIHR
jgi:signal transduction histidine kinase/CheY-like chemotaxis protein